MKEITVPTNMHCANCVSKLARVLDQAPGIHHWKANINVPEKLVTVQGELNEQQLVELIRQAGFEAGVSAPVHCETHEGKKPVAEKLSFWRDRKLWKRASFNTFTCLLGCSIGDFLMIIYLQVYHPGTPMWLQMLLAVVAGLTSSIILETALMRYREKFNWKAAFKMAVSMSFLSMIAMEVAMNTIDFMITGGKAQLTSVWYWLAFLPAAVAGFLTPLPYNYYQLKKHNRACH